MLTGLVVLGLPAMGDGGARPAFAEPEFDVALRDQLLEDTTPGQWRAVLEEVVAQEPRWIGHVIGALFREREAYADHAPCVAFTAAFLIDHPVNEKIYLAGEILRRAHGDGAFLADMRSHITGGVTGEGWGRLGAVALEMLAQDDLPSRMAAIWFLGRQSDPTPSVLGARAKAVWALHARATEDLALVADQAEASARRLEASYLEAFYELLRYRFPTLAAAVEMLGKEGLSRLSYADLVLHFSTFKDSDSSPERRLLLSLAKRAVDVVVQGGDPAGLREFLDPKVMPVEIRRYALRQTGTMNPKVDTVWRDLFCWVLQQERDAENLRVALRTLEQVDFGTDSEMAAKLARCVMVRLRGLSDPLEDLTRLAKVLGALRDREQVLYALEVATSPSTPVVLVAELIRALGGVRGARVADVLPYYAGHDATTDRGRAIRTAAVDALGRSGIASSDDAPAAAKALRDIVSGGENGVQQASNADVRLSAIRSLKSYPGPDSAEVLKAVATDTNDAEAQAAIVVLKTGVSRDISAIHALGAIAANRDVAADRRLQALDAFRSLNESGPEGGLRAARDATRIVLAATDSPVEVRLQAADAAATLADPVALDPMLAFWVEAPEAVRRGEILQALLLGVAKAGPTHDARIAAAFDRIAEAGQWDLATAAATACTTAYPRMPLLVARAGLLYRHALVEDRTAEDRQADLVAADRMLASMLGDNPGPELEAAIRLRVDVLAELGRLAADPAGRKVHYLVAVELAARSADRGTAARGRDIGAQLSSEPLGPLLTEEEATRLTAATRRIDTLLAEG